MSPGSGAWRTAGEGPSAGFGSGVLRWGFGSGILRWAAAGLALMTFAACSSAPEESPAPGPNTGSVGLSCPEGGDGELSMEALSSLAGSHTLVIEAQDGSRAEASLVLEAVPDAEAEVLTVPGAEGQQPGRALLRGWTDLDPAAVGGFAPGALDSQDPARPGALLLVSPGADGGSTVMVRLGAQANDRRRTDFDGGHFALTIRWARSNAGFGGTWTSRGAGRRASGSFCALPASASP